MEINIAIIELNLSIMENNIHIVESNIAIVEKNMPTVEWIFSLSLPKIICSPMKTLNHSYQIPICTNLLIKSDLVISKLVLIRI